MIASTSNNFDREGTEFSSARAAQRLVKRSHIRSKKTIENRNVLFAVALTVTSCTVPISHCRENLERRVRLRDSFNVTNGWMVKLKIVHNFSIIFAIRDREFFANKDEIL